MNVIIIIGIILFISLIIAVSNSGKATKDAEKQRAFEATIQSRKAAEIDRIRREKTSGPLSRMSDNELGDLIQRSAEDLREAKNRANNLAGTVSFLGIVIGGFVAGSEGSLAPLIVIGLVGMIAGALSYQFVINHADNTIGERGLDPTRLKIKE